MKYQFARPTAINTEKLDAELKAQIPAVTGITTTPDAVFVIADTLTDQEQITAQTIITAHSATLTAAQQQDADGQAAAADLEAARKYLKRQLFAASPDSLTDMVSKIKPGIDNNPKYTIAMQRQIGLLKQANGWSSSIATIMNPSLGPDRAKYVAAFQVVIALLA